MRTVYIGTTLVTPWASVLAQEDRGSVQILAAFSTELGGLRYHMEEQVIRGFANTRAGYFAIGKACADPIAMTT